MKIFRTPFLILILGVFSGVAVAGVDAGKAGWNFARYQAVMQESGRKPGLNEKTFSEVQERRKEALKIIEEYLNERLRKADPLVLRAFSEVPREYYHYNYQDNQSSASVA